MFWVWSVPLLSWNFLSLSLLLLLIALNVLNFCIFLVHSTWVYFNFLIFRVSHLRGCMCGYVCMCMHMDVCMREWECTWENWLIFPIRPEALRKVLRLFFSAQARYLSRHLSDRKFVIQALTVMLATGTEFDCITKHTALHHFVLSRVEVENQ